MIGPGARALGVHGPGRLARLAILGTVVFLLVGCSHGGGTATTEPAALLGAVTAAPSPSPAATPDRTPSPSPTPSPAPMPSRFERPDTRAAAVPPVVRVTWPAAGTARSGSVAVALVWSSTGAVRTDVSVEHSSGASSNLDCASVSWRPGPTLVSRTSPLRAPDLLPGHCYRFLVTAWSSTGAVATARSGTLWIEPVWEGGIDLYRSGVFATQQTLDWCVPAAVEMVRNIVDGRSSHSYAEQAAFYRYGRAHLYTDYPVPGLDPTATTALLAHLGQAYGDFRARTLDEMERQAVRQLRRTGKPVILYVDAGVHAWVLDGFTATADPAITDTFAITSFSVLGPLWPTERYHDGYYDMPPDTALSPGAFAAAVGRAFHEPTRPVPWEGWYVITQPL